MIQVIYTRSLKDGCHTEDNISDQKTSSCLIHLNYNLKYFTVWVDFMNKKPEVCQILGRLDDVVSGERSDNT